MKLRIIFQIKFNPCFSPEINFSSIFEQGFCTVGGQVEHIMGFLSFFLLPLFCKTCINPLPPKRIWF